MKPLMSHTVGRRLAGLGSALLWLLASPAQADEGMWTFNRLPLQALQQSHGFAPTPAWLDHLRLSALRLSSGCSASLVSPQGLVMTNHHCARGCIDAAAAAAGRDFGRDGFLAGSTDEEPVCPGLEAQQLLSIDDVTAQANAALGQVPADRFAEALKRFTAEQESRCADAPGIRCEVVQLYRGGRYDLYRYRRHRQVRLVFAPEEAIGFFGGDPDNFDFPRHDLDVTFLRVVGADGRPAPTAHWLAWAERAPRDGELAFVAGHPGGTSREMTLDQLALERDSALPYLMTHAAEWRGVMSAYIERGAEQRRHGTDPLFGIENWLKSMKGQHGALADPAFWAQLQQRETTLRQRVAADPALRAAAGGAWDRVADLVAEQRRLNRDYWALERAQRGYGDLFNIARAVLRHADERQRPNAERLREFSDARLPGMAQWVLSAEPIYDELEIERLAWGLTKLREDLGTDHPAVRAVLGRRAPAQVARDAVRGTALRALTVDAQGQPTGGARKRLWDADAKALAAAADPMVELARALDGPARAVRQATERRVDGPLAQQQEAIAKARFALDGEALDPDATGTLRLSYGTVQGWTEPDGRVIAPVTTLGDAFERHTGEPPYALPPSWLQARARLALGTALNFVTNHDIIGGNSGSPMVDRDGALIGLIFDGNLHSLGGDYGFDARRNRAVAVSTAGIGEALDKVYGATGLLHELRAGGAARR